MPVLNALQVGLVAGVIGLDRLALGQFMFSQPIVAAPLIGWMLGDFHSGLLIGVVLELFWLKGLPVGGYIPRDATLSAILTAGLALSSPTHSGWEETAWIAWAFLWVGLLLLPAGYLDQWVRKKNAFLIQVAVPSDKPERSLARSILFGLMVYFFYYFVFTFLVLLFGSPLLEKGYALLSDKVLQGLRLFLFLLPMIGVVSLMNRKELVKKYLYFLVGGVTSLILFAAMGKLNGWSLSLLFLMGVVMIAIKPQKHALTQ